MTTQCQKLTLMHIIWDLKMKMIILFVAFVMISGVSFASQTAPGKLTGVMPFEDGAIHVWGLMRV